MKTPTAWVVYRMTTSGNGGARNAVCTQSEWDVMETTRPGYHTLIRGQIGNEGEAERLARDLQTVPPVAAPARLSYSARRRLERSEIAPPVPQ